METDPSDLRLIHHTSLSASDALREQGYETAAALTVGYRGAEFTAKLIFATLREMGVIPPEGIDNARFARIATEIAMSTETQVSTHTIIDKQAS